MWKSDFASIWYGTSYDTVRTSLGADKEFDECRFCWYRESK